MIIVLGSSLTHKIHQFFNVNNERIQDSLANTVSDDPYIKLIWTGLKICECWNFQYFTLYTHSNFAVCKSICIKAGYDLCYFCDK